MRRAAAIVVAALLLATLPAAAQEGAPLKRYTFAEAIARAQSRNPSAEVARQEIRRAQGLVREAAAASLPSLASTVTGLHLDKARSFNGKVFQNADSVSGNATLAVPLVAVQRWMQWAQARDNLTVARASAQDVRRSVSIATAQAYLAVVVQHRLVDVGDTALKNAQAHYVDARDRREGGVGNRIDEAQAEQLVEITRAQIEVEDYSLIKAQEALSVLLAEDSRVDVAPEALLPELPGLETALDEAVRQRTDVKLIEQRVVAARRAANEDYAGYLPSLVGAFIFQFQYPAAATVPLESWQAQAVISIPIFDGLYLVGVHREHRALEQEARIDLAATQRQARAEVRTAFEELGHAERALAASRRSAALANEALALLAEAFHTGAATSLEVIDAQRTARNADIAVAQAEDAVRQARLDLLAAAGRFP